MALLNECVPTHPNTRLLQRYLHPDCSLEPLRRASSKTAKLEAEPELQEPGSKLGLHTV